MRLFLYDIDYREHRGSIYIILYGRTEDGASVAVYDTSYRPYFYVLPSDVSKAEKEIREVLKKKRFPVGEIVQERLLWMGQERTFLKIYCPRPQDTTKARDIIKMLEKERGGSGSVIDEYEYQIGFYRSYLFDKGISCMQWVTVEGEEISSDIDADRVLQADRVEPEGWDVLRMPGPRVLAFDTEVVEQKRGQRSLVMVSLYSRDQQRVITYQKGAYPEYVEVVEDERALIERFVQFIQEYDPDIVVGYNSDLYDFDVIRERASALKTDLGPLSRDNSGVTLAKRARFSTARLKGRVHIDIFNFINNILAPMLQTEVLTLDSVSSEILGDEKIEMEYHEIVEAWQKGKDLGRLATYCLKDSELTFRLSEVLLPQIFQLTQLVCQSLYDTSRMTYSQLVEWFYSKKAKQTRRVIPNQPKFDEIKRRQKETYTGGYVKEPLAGMHEGVAVIDFASLYPSIVSTYNISIETLNCECCKGDGHSVPEMPYHFCKRREGFESSIVRELLMERENLKKEMKNFPKDSPEYHLYDTRQKAVKTIANASYGYYAFPASKWYSKECAESITAYGRYWIKRIMDEAEARGFTPVYGDTDSAFLLMDGRKDDELLGFLEELNSSLPGIMKVELEGFYLRGLFIPKEVGGGTAKKRYALVDREGNLKVRGLEKVRRDWSMIAKRTQERVLRMVLNEKDIDGAVRYVRETIQRIRDLRVSLRDLVVYEQLSKPIEQYKQTSPHVEAAKKLRDQGITLNPGSVIGYVITKGTGSLSKRAVPVEFADLRDVDTDYYIQNQILPATLRILKVLGVKDEEFTAQTSVF